MVNGNWKPPTKGETTEELWKKYIKQHTIREMGVRHSPPKDREIPKTKTIKKRTWGIILACITGIAYTFCLILLVGVLRVLIAYAIVGVMYCLLLLCYKLITSEDE